MGIESALGLVNRVMNKHTRARIVWTALLCVGLIGILDYKTGLDISLSLFYLGPVGIAGWYAGRKSGALVALISSLAALAGKLTEGQFYAHPWITSWNGLLHLGFMLVVVYLLDRLHVTIEKEHNLARTDPMTGLFNRRAFLEQLQYCLALAERDGEPISLAYIDLDNFKLINDEGGHEQGDRVLRLFADTLMASIRRTDVLARLGGDEFILLIVGADRAAAESLIDKARLALRQAFEFEPLKITCSIGCVIFQERLPDAEGAIKAADTLMYDIKNQGKDAVVFKAFSENK
jgi:diguanylate cyclase (GGDEF)-like protein